MYYDLIVNGRRAQAFLSRIAAGAIPRVKAQHTLLSSDSHMVGLQWSLGEGLALCSTSPQLCALLRLLPSLNRPIQSRAAIHMLRLLKSQTRHCAVHGSPTPTV